LTEIGESATTEVTPSSWEFGQQSIDSSSEPVEFTIRNIGGGILSISPNDIEITGSDADAFILENISTSFDLGPFETTAVSVTFGPSGTGEKTAVLQVIDIAIPLTGSGTEPNDYFVYSDFTISGFTNVEGYREIPGWALGLTATDLSGEGEFGGAILQLDYNLEAVDDQTAYWMWAYPSANISGYDNMVIFIKADEPASNVRIQLFDTDGIQGLNGASYTYIDVDTEWQGLVLPVNDFSTIDWAENLPDMSKIQRIDITFENGLTTPLQNTIYVDMVGFEEQSSSVTDLTNNDSFKMYPNPAGESITLVTPEQTHISFIDLHGNVLINQISNQNQTTVDISALLSGIYIVKVQNQKGTSVKKLLVL
jgi:hypothetical protein